MEDFWKKEVIVHVEHVFCPEDDRWILIERYEGGQIGLAFCQGDDYEVFKKHCANIDEVLSKFYYIMYRDFYEGASQDEEIFIINKIMWLYHETQQIWGE